MRGLTNPVVDRQGGRRYDDTWAAALSGAPDWVVVTSWNEWFEGTSVEEMAARFVKEYRPTSLIQRFASVQEVANMVVYAVSKEASATNGAALRVDGGVVSTIV